MILELFILLNCLTLKVSYYNLKERDHIIISNSLSIISKHHQGVPYLKMKTKIISMNTFNTHRPTYSFLCT